MDAVLSKANKFLSEVSGRSAIVIGGICDRFRNWIDVVMCSGDSFLGVEIGEEGNAVVNILSCRDNSVIGFTKTEELNRDGFAFTDIEDKVYSGAMTCLGRNLINATSVNGRFCIALRNKENSCRMVECVGESHRLVRKFNVCNTVDVVDVMESFNDLVENVEKYFNDDGGANIESCSLDLIGDVIDAAFECIATSEVKKSVEASVISEEYGEEIISKLKSRDFVNFDYLKKCDVFDNMGVQICDARDPKKKKIALKKIRTWRQEYNKLASE